MVNVNLFKEEKYFIFTTVYVYCNYDRYKTLNTLRPDQQLRVNNKRFLTYQIHTHRKQCQLSLSVYTFEMYTLTQTHTVSNFIVLG